MAILGFIVLVLVTLFVTFYFGVLVVAASFLHGMEWVMVLLLAVVAVLWYCVFHFAPFSVNYIGA